MKTCVTLLLAGCLLSAASRAQTGPWTDGEILVQTVLQPSGQGAIVRVVPETGATAVLVIPQYFGGWAGSKVFDSYRGGLLANVSLPPDGTFLFRLWLVSHDGTAVAMPGFTGSLRALASTGDGRVFFIRHTSSAQGPQPIEYFDANDVIQTLMQADGVTPFTADVEHLIYDPASNALIGSSSAWWAATACGAEGASLYRFPLSADGLRVDDPVTCTAVPLTVLYAGEIMGLDHLPDGNLLVTTATGWLGAPRPMLSLDPVTLAFAFWAEPASGDVNGGFWSARLGKAVVHTNNGSAWWEPDGLRTYSPGQTGFGNYIATSIPVPTGGGFGPGESIFEVDLNGPACQGFQLPYGAGLAGTGGQVPLLGVIGCPDLGESFTLSITAAVGGAPGMLFVGLSALSVPFKGGTFLVGDLAAQFPMLLPGTPGVAGAGFLALPVMLTEPILSGVSIYTQAGFADAEAVHGASLTNGLRIQAN